MSLGGIRLEAVSREFAERSYDRLKEFYRGYLEESKRPENRGDVHVALGVLMKNFFNPLKDDDNENDRQPIQ